MRPIFQGQTHPNQIHPPRKPTMKQIRIGAAIVLLLVLGIYGLAGIVDIEAGEIGIKVKMVGSDRGMQKETIPTGLRWVDPILYDVFVYDTRSHQEDVAVQMEAQTKDGQPILVDISLEISLIADSVPDLHVNIGEDYFNRVIVPDFRSMARTKIATELSDVVYTGEGRTRIANAIQKEMNIKLNQNGIKIVVNFRKLDFVNQNFVATLEKKAIAGQKEEIERREAKAAEQIAIKVANIAEGAKQKVIKEAEAQRDKDRLQGEGFRLQQEERAKGILAVGQADAEVVRLQNEAMNGPGGDKIVALKWAETLGPNVKVYGIPTGSPGTASMMDLNGILGGAFKGMSPVTK